MTIKILLKVTQSERNFLLDNTLFTYISRARVMFLLIFSKIVILRTCQKCLIKKNCKHDAVNVQTLRHA